VRAAPVARPYVSSLGAPPIEDIHNAIPPLPPPSGAGIERLDRRRELGEGSALKRVDPCGVLEKSRRGSLFVRSSVGWVG